MPSIISSAAVASLALGIGGALAMFTLVNSVLLRPLAVDRPNELATLSTVAAAQDRRTEMFSYATFEDIRRRGLFDGVFTSHASAPQAFRSWYRAPSSSARAAAAPG